LPLPQIAAPAYDAEPPRPLPATWTEPDDEDDADADAQWGILGEKAQRWRTIPPAGRP